jgi:hypothetical protein
MGLLSQRGREPIPGTNAAQVRPLTDRGGRKQILRNGARMSVGVYVQRGFVPRRGSELGEQRGLRGCVFLFSACVLVLAHR